MPFGPPDWPAAANLTPHESGVKGWTFADFDNLMTTGKTKDGHALKAPMVDVIQQTAKMTETERKALWTYLASVPALATNQ